MWATCTGSGLKKGPTFRIRRCSCRDVSQMQHTSSLRLTMVSRSSAEVMASSCLWTYHHNSQVPNRMRFNLGRPSDRAICPAFLRTDHHGSSICVQHLLIRATKGPQRVSRTPVLCVTATIASLVLQMNPKGNLPTASFVPLAHATCVLQMSLSNPLKTFTKVMNSYFLCTNNHTCRILASQNAFRSERDQVIDSSFRYAC